VRESSAPGQDRQILDTDRQAQAVHGETQREAARIVGQAELAEKHNGKR